MPDVEDAEVLRALWSLVWSGRVAGDTFAPVRGLLGGGRTSHKPRQRPPRLSRYAIRHGTFAGRGVGLRADAVPAPPTGVGRWSLLPAVETDPTIRAHAWAELLLDRYGVLTRSSVVAEDLPGGFAATYRVLAAAEEAGRVRRGYFIEGLGASQFGSTGAIDRLRRSGRAESGDGGALVLAASDPANPYGAALSWPAHTTGDWGDDSAPGQPRRGHQPARKAGALVVIVDGALVLYLERGGRTLLSWSDDPVVLGLAARAVAAAVQAGSLGRLTIEKVDGSAVLGSRHPLAVALAEAGFHLTPRGLRLRR